MPLRKDGVKKRSLYFSVTDMNRASRKYRSRATVRLTVNLAVIRNSIFTFPVKQRQKQVTKQRCKTEAKSQSKLIVTSIFDGMPKKYKNNQKVWKKFFCLTITANFIFLIKSKKIRLIKTIKTEVEVGWVLGVNASVKLTLGKIHD